LAGIERRGKKWMDGGREEGRRARERRRGEWRKGVCVRKRERDREREVERRERDGQGERVGGR
jgi:hypothetical protein